MKKLQATVYTRVVTYRFPVKGKNLSNALAMERQKNLPT